MQLSRIFLWLGCSKGSGDMAGWPVKSEIAAYGVGIIARDVNYTRNTLYYHRVILI